MQKYTNTEVQVSQHVVFCTLSILMSVPEENFNAHSTNAVPNFDNGVFTCE